MNGNTRNALLLGLLCLILLIPAAALRELQGMEFRTALFVREILLDGPSLVPHLGGVPYYDYPPLYFLAAALASRVSGTLHPLALALPGIAAAAGVTFIVCILAGRERRPLGWMAGLALVTTPAFAIFSSRAMVDGLLTFWVTLSCAGFFLSIDGASFTPLLLACAGLAGGVLTKGPIGAVLPLAVCAAYLVLSRRARAGAVAFLLMAGFAVLYGAALVAAVIMVEGRDIMDALMQAQVFDRLHDAPNAPRLYYVGVFFGSFAPWSFFAAFELFRRSERKEAPAVILFSKVWLAVTFLALSLAAIKHTRYLLTAAPPAAILCAAFWEEALSRRASNVARILLSALGHISTAALAAAILFSILAPLRLPIASPALVAAVPLACLIILGTVARAGRGDARGIFALFAAAIAVWFLVACQFAFPYADMKDNAAPFVGKIERAAGRRPVVFHGISKDGDGLKYLYWRRGCSRLVFTATRDECARAVAAAAPALLVVPARDKEEVRSQCGAAAEHLFEGNLGKRRCAVFRVTAPDIHSQ